MISVSKYLNFYEWLIFPIWKENLAYYRYMHTKQNSYILAYYTCKYVSRCISKLLWEFYYVQACWKGEAGGGGRMPPSLLLAPQIFGPTYNSPLQDFRPYNMPVVYLEAWGRECILTYTKSTLLYIYCIHTLL